MAALCFLAAVRTLTLTPSMRSIVNMQSIRNRYAAQPTQTITTLSNGPVGVTAVRVKWVEE